MFTHRNTYHSLVENLGVGDAEMNSPEGLATQVRGGGSADSFQLSAPLGSASTAESLILTEASLLRPAIFHTEREYRA